MSNIMRKIQGSEIYYRFLQIENKQKKTVIAVLAVFSLIIPCFVSSYLMSIFMFIIIYSIVGAGVYLLIGYAGIISLGQVGFYCLGAYVSAVFSTFYNISPWLSLCCAAIINAFFAYILGKPFLRTIYLTEITGLSLSIITLAFASIVYLFVSRLPITGGHDGIAGIPALSVMGYEFTDKHYYYFSWIILGFILLFSYNITEKKLGRGLRALNIFSGGDQLAAMTSGINSAKLKLHVFMLSAVYASIAGSICAHWLTVVNPDLFGIMVTFIFVLAVGIGGFRSVWGPLVGTAFYFMTKELLTRLMAGKSVLGAEIVIFSLIFIVILLFVPEGLTSLPHKWREWRHEFRRWRYKETDLTPRD